MGEPQYSHNHIVNPETGYVENPAYPNQFDSTRKVAFLKLYRENGIRLRQACRSMGLSEGSVYAALRNDPKFKHEFDAVEHDYLEELESTSKMSALNPKSIIERIFQLKCHMPDKYGQENRPINTTINVNFGSITDGISGRAPVIDVSAMASDSTQELRDAPIDVTPSQPTEGQ